MGEVTAPTDTHARITPGSNDATIDVERCRRPGRFEWFVCGLNRRGGYAGSNVVLFSLETCIQSIPSGRMVLP